MIGASESVLRRTSHTACLFATVLWLTTVAVVEIGDLDIKLATLLFHWQGSSWSYREHWLISDWLHNGARKAAGGVLITVWLAALASLIPATALRPWRSALVYLALVLPAGPLLVGLLKATLPVPCPWDLVVFGGQLPDAGGWWSTLDGWRMGASGCFPAGHASGGYAFLSSYFVLRRLRPTWRYYGLGAGLLLGTVFGAAQQLRGAHFLSHDLWSLAICWLVALLGYKVWQRLEPVSSRFDQPAFYLAQDARR